MFTLPAPVAEIAFHNNAVVYAVLFRAAAEALRRVAADPRHLGAEIGAVAVLHTWGQALHHHPHLHCIVPGGGISPDGTRWIACRPRFFLPVRVLSRRFRDLFLDQLRAAFADGKLRCSGALAGLVDPAAFAARLDAAAQIDWVVFAKPPFAGPGQVLGYLGRYTHRVAIANSRLVGLDDGQLSFTWKNYRQDGKTKVMILPADEFIRRFLQHTMPDGFHRIRHLGFLANRHRTAKLALCRDLLAAPLPPDPEPEPEAAVAGSPPRPYRPRRRGLPRVRRPDAAPRHAAALPAASPAHVVRQLMTQPWSPPVRPVLQGNAHDGAGPLLPHTAFAVAARFAVLENSVTRSITRAPTHPNTARAVGS